jgi:hypothetical protein
MMAGDTSFGGTFFFGAAGVLDLRFALGRRFGLRGADFFFCLCFPPAGLSSVIFSKGNSTSRAKLAVDRERNRG